jgi:hypothetical protein
LIDANGFFFTNFARLCEKEFQMMFVLASLVVAGLSLALGLLRVVREVPQRNEDFAPY